MVTPNPAVERDCAKARSPSLLRWASPLTLNIGLDLYYAHAYAAPHRDDGVRILVDRLWPRGVTKEGAAIDQWFRECAPSNELRKWFGHDRAKWEEFKQKYFAELEDKEELLAPIRALCEKRVTLLFGASDNECNNAVALMEYLGTSRPNIRRRKKP